MYDSTVIYRYLLSIPGSRKRLRVDVKDDRVVDSSDAELIGLIWYDRSASMYPRARTPGESLRLARDLRDTPRTLPGRVVSVETLKNAEAK